MNEVREAWRVWADGWARDFNALCPREGFLPDSALQQRNLFDEVVRPLTVEHGATALFMVDALRYEMAEELYRTLADIPASTVSLKARFAELPTVTEVGMNALAPVVHHGRLRPALSDGGVLGFSTGEYRVNNPETRRRAMADRVGGATCPLLTLDEVLNRDATSLGRAIARAKLVVVHSQEIDIVGENGVGPNVFESVLQKLRAAWQLLREAGVRRFVLTADHGFLLLDETAHESALAHGRKVDPKRRYAFSTVPADHTGEARVALADLGYEASGHLMFPESTAVFQTGRRDLSFVYGGNSLAERVIPVLTVQHRTAAGGDTGRYEVVAVARDGVAGLLCVEARIGPVAHQGALAFAGTRELDIGLRVVDGPDVLLEVCDVSGAARRLAGTIRASVGAPFEVFFRLTGPDEARVQIEVHHPGAEADVGPAVVDRRFIVTALPRASEGPPSVTPATKPAADPRAWLAQLPEGGPRKVFAHIAEHGAITEVEANGMFGNPRGLRAFAISFEGYTAKAPFGVRIETVGGVKRYVREESRG